MILYRAHKSPLLVPILSHIITVHTIPSYFIYDYTICSICCFVFVFVSFMTLRIRQLNICTGLKTLLPTSFHIPPIVGSIDEQANTMFICLSSAFLHAFSLCLLLQKTCIITPRGNTAEAEGRITFIEFLSFTHFLLFIYTSNAYILFLNFLLKMVN